MRAARRPISRNGNQFSPHLMPVSPYKILIDHINPIQNFPVCLLQKFLNSKSRPSINLVIWKILVLVLASLHPLFTSSCLNSGLIPFVFPSTFRPNLPLPHAKSNPTTGSFSPATASLIADASAKTPRTSASATPPSSPPACRPHPRLCPTCPQIFNRGRTSGNRASDLLKLQRTRDSPRAQAHRRLHSHRNQ